MFNIIVFKTNCLLIFIFKIFFKFLFCLKFYVCFERWGISQSSPRLSFSGKQFLL